MKALEEIVWRKHEQGETDRQIQRDMEADPNAVSLSYGQVKRFVTKHKLRGANPPQNNPPGRPPDPNIDAKIRKVLDKIPTASTRLIAQLIKRDHTTVYRHLTNSMGYKYRSVRWIPHFLNEDHKIQRVQQSTQLLRLLESQDRMKWKFIYTGDESWFFYDNQVQKLWMAADEKRPFVERPNIMSKKIMVCIFWNPHGILILKAMKRGHALNSACFIEEILIPITCSEEFHEAKIQKQKFVLHMDNSRVHRSEVVQNFMHDSKLKNAPHPAFSPDLAPSDFYLFGKLKLEMIGIEFSSEDELIDWIVEKFRAIPREELESVLSMSPSPP